ncbi:MAG: hypothetical protein EOM62_14255 [Bacteroidia bacterium]|nr:hypothetical protein [Bacteroidia bacterium]
MAETKVVKKKIVKKKAVEEKVPVLTTSKTEVITPQIVVSPPGMCSWRKKEGATFRLGNGKKVKPNEVFRAYPSEIPPAFRDLFELLEGDENAVERVITAPSKFVIGVREDGLFDVVDPDGKCLNDEPLGEEDAKRLLLALTV